jgi:hypothetical protein
MAIKKRMMDRIRKTPLMNLKFMGSIYLAFLSNSVMLPKVNQINLNEAFNRRNYI